MTKHFSEKEITIIELSEIENFLLFLKLVKNVFYRNLDHLMGKIFDLYSKVLFFDVCDNKIIMEITQNYKLRGKTYEECEVVFLYLN